jgi:hypothetical protein
MQLRSTTPLAFDQPTLAVAAAYPNVKFHHTSLETLAIGTPIEKWLKNNPFTENKNNHSYPNIISGAMDLTKLLMLYKYGTFVLDTDVIVIKNLEGLSNAVGFERDDGTICNNAMTFTKKHKVIELAFDIFPKRYDKSLNSKDFISLNIS